MDNLNYETIIKKLIKRHSPKLKYCEKCGEIDSLHLATHCTNCKIEYELDYEKLMFAVDLIKGFIYKYSNIQNNKNIDSVMLKLLDEIIYSTDNQYLGNISSNKEKNVYHFINVFFEFLLSNKIILGNPFYNICILPDFTIFFNSKKLKEISLHFGDIEFSMPFFMGSFAYVDNFHKKIKTSFWEN